MERMAPCSGGTGAVAPKRLSTSSSMRSSPSRELASTTIGLGSRSRSVAAAASWRASGEASNLRLP